MKTYKITCKNTIKKVSARSFFDLLLLIVLDYRYFAQKGIKGIVEE